MNKDLLAKLARPVNVSPQRNGTTVVQHVHPPVVFRIPRPVLKNVSKDVFALMDYIFEMIADVLLVINVQEDVSKRMELVDLIVHVVMVYVQ
jgi:hypothetical protein